MLKHVWAKLAVHMPAYRTSAPKGAGGDLFRAILLHLCQDQVLICHCLVILLDNRVVCSMVSVCVSPEGLDDPSVRPRSFLA
jgi:hypothetical protein